MTSVREPDLGAVKRRVKKDLGATYGAVLEQYAAGDPRGFLLLDGQRTVLALNGAARTLLSYGGPAERPALEVVRDVHFGFAVGEALHDGRLVEHESYAPDPDRLLRFQLLPIVDRDEVPVLVVATVEDITNLRHLETVRRDFVANVSHELRTPLASINLLVETLQRGAIGEPDAAAHFLHRIEVETMAMARLVEELLELSRLERGVLTLNLEPVPVVELLRDVLSRLAPAAEEKQISMRLDAPQTPLAVQADCLRLEQVLMNLVHNAIKFTPVGGTVSLKARRQGRGVDIEVTDTGMGMGPADAPRVFERFYKVDKGRNRAEGAGLGLAIAHHLVALHGSQLHVVSEVGRGSRFCFALPVAG